MKKVSLAGFATQTPASKSAKAYPLLPDPDGQVGELVTSILDKSAQVEALEGGLEIGEGGVDRHCEAVLLPALLRAARCAASSVEARSADGKVVRVGFSNSYRGTSDEPAITRIAGEHAARYVKQSFELKIKGDLIPDAAVEPLLSELQELFARREASAALSAKATIKPTKEFSTAHHTLFSVAEEATMNEIKFTLRLTDGRWVSSPTNTVADNPNLAGVFTAADDESAAELRSAMECLHGPLDVVPWQSKRTAELQDPFAGAEVLYAYTRKDALNDGVQVDVSETARGAGLKFPVYLTRAVWENYVVVPHGVRCQDESGRLWDIVWMLRGAARRTSGPQMLFSLHVRNDNRDRTPPLVKLKAVCGPLDIDDPQPAITVMLLDED